ncbi:AP2-ERF domain [Babesia duncani]|uniref:AP2-ERF domain n=1 Tax=Babesia duncani TaxID=323732 RepID=A0AAD9PKM7_9APIC|nr:AP2-ERF domain [Babesia duncani]
MNEVGKAPQNESSMTNCRNGIDEYKNFNSLDTNGYYLDSETIPTVSAQSSSTTLYDSGDETSQIVNVQVQQDPTNNPALYYPEPFVYPNGLDVGISPLLDTSIKKRENVISGVKFQPSDNRWIARWTTADGKRACKSFSVNIYGFDQARALAIEARHKGVSLSGRSFCNRERQHAMRSGVGIIGIRFDKTQARWVSSYYEGGKRKFRYFTVKDYGYEQAKQHAILWKTCNDERLIRNRQQQMMEMPLEQNTSDNWPRTYNSQDYALYYNPLYLQPSHSQAPPAQQQMQHQQQQELVGLDYEASLQQQTLYSDFGQYCNYSTRPEDMYQYYDQVQYAANMQECQIPQEEETCSVSGVTLDKKNRRWGARWTAPDGRRAGRYFPIRQYGFHEAKRLAVLCRLQALENVQGSDSIE